MAVRSTFLVAFTVSASLFASWNFAVADATFGPNFTNDNTSPTDLGLLQPGLNSISGTVNNAPANSDFFTFQIGANTEIDSWVLSSYESNDNLAFLAINDASTFPFQILTNGTTSQMEQMFLGGSTFGSLNENTDLLPSIGTIAGRGFTGPLGEGTYAVLVQQLGGATTGYTFGLNVTAVPEPTTFAALAIVTGGAVLRRRKLTADVAVAACD